MLPTTYRGDATVAGEDLDAELFLDDVHLRLLSGAGGRSEIVKWPLPTVRIEPVERGRYLFEAGNESFEFSPLVDDGLSDEIALRTRFAATPEPLAPFTDSSLSSDTSSSSTIADKVRSVGSRRRGPNHRRRGVMSGGDLAVRTALVILGALALVVVTVAVVSGSFDRSPGTVVISEGSTPDTLAFTDDAAPATTGGPVTTVAPTPTTAPPATSVPPTSVPPTTTAPSTTVPPTTTTAAADTVEPAPTARPGLDLAPEELIDRWDDVSAELGGVLPASAADIGESSFSFDAGGRTTIEGSVGPDGTVEALTLVGDPGGTVEEDRLVITAMGMVIAVAAPDLEPDGRRALLETLGFDFSDPDVAELDGTLNYRTYDYALRWDDELERIVFEINPIGPASGEESSPDSP